MIEVGEEKRKYHVHKNLVVYHFKFFKGAFEGSTKEAEEDLIHMDNVDASSGTFSYPMSIKPYTDSLRSQHLRSLALYLEYSIIQEQDSLGLDPRVPREQSQQRARSNPP